MKNLIKDKKIEHYMPNALHFAEKSVDIKQVTDMVSGKGKKQGTHLKKRIRTSWQTYCKRDAHSLIDSGNIKAVENDIEEFIKANPSGLISEEKMKEGSTKFTATSGRIYGFHVDKNYVIQRLYPISGPNITSKKGIDFCEEIYKKFKEMTGLQGVQQSGVELLEQEINKYKTKLSTGLSSTQPSSSSCISKPLPLRTKRRQEQRDDKSQNQTAYEALVNGSNIFKSRKLLDQTEILQPAVTTQPTKLISLDPATTSASTSTPVPTTS